MPRSALTGLDRKGLRRWLALFFLALALPTGVLIWKAYSELKWEAFHLYRGQAEELTARIDDHVQALIHEEEARPFTDYAFLNVAGAPSANFLQRSPLAAWPVTAEIPGLLGWFQVDSEGRFTTPLLPREGAGRYGISSAELAQRRDLAQRLQHILGENRLVTAAGASVAGKTAARAEHKQDKAMDAEEEVALMDAAPSAGASIAMQEAPPAPASAPVPAQAAFDQLAAVPTRQVLKGKREGNLGRVEDLKLQQNYQSAPAPEVQRRGVEKKKSLLEKRLRKERSALPEPQSAETRMAAPSPPALRIRTFESEIDPFELSLLASGHFVLYRKVWRDGARYIQGALIEQQPFLRGLVEPYFRGTALAQMSDLTVAYGGEVFATFSGRAARGYSYRAEELSGELLYRTRLSAPLDGVELISSINHLPAGPGGVLIAWVGAILVLVLCGGFYLLYRLGAAQIDLARQQQDFVSAVSHELKTPLTSIRMYAEMLREGWAGEEKRRGYYDYIHDESERLSRLIANVLQLARMTRNRLQMQLIPVSAEELLDGIRAKVASQVERAGFALHLDCPETVGGTVIQVDPDHFTQILINLVDNAIKFSAKAQTRSVDIGCRATRNGWVQFSVRDYGPGVPRDQMKKIFKLFYRSESELTRETVGTGIGLSLVHQLVLAMHGKVEVVNREPGAEFWVSLPGRT